MMNPRQNMLESIHGGKPEYVPIFWDSIQPVGIFASGLEMPAQDGSDLYGVPWVVTTEGAMPKPGFMLFEDIEDWEKYVKIPNIDDIDFDALMEMEKAFMPPYDRENRVLQFLDNGGVFDRMVSFMGFENALCALVYSPEDCMDLFEALTDFKIKFINRMIDVFNPDIYCIGDDIATANNLFMSPETYRKVIKPFDARMAEAVRKRGVIFERHCCGKCEEVIPDFVEMGVQVWQSAQPMNDIAGILDTYQGKLALEGGWDSSGPASYSNSTDEQVRAEIRRCLTEYKKPGMMLWPLLYNEKGNAMMVGDRRLPALMDEWNKYRFF